MTIIAADARDVRAGSRPRDQGSSELERQRVSTRRRNVVLLLCVLAVLGFYLRCGWTYGKQLDPAPDRTDFQNRQTDAFLAGQLNLELEVPPGLLQLDDPLDAVANAPYRGAGLHDLSLHGGKLYSYFGVAPVLLLYLPYRLLGVGDLSPTLACLVFCSLGFLASVGTFRIVVGRFLRPLSVAGEALAILALGLAAPVGWLVSIGRGYEAAIACGYFLVFAGLFVLSAGLFRAVHHRNAYLAVGTSLLAASVGARPSLFWVLLFVPFALAYVWNAAGRRRLAAATWLASLGPVAIIGIALAWYNWTRFGSVSEFGTSYMMLGENVRLARADELEFLGRGLFEYVLSPAVWTDGFPWISLRPLSFPTPTESNYLTEPIAGLLPNMPACVLGIVAACCQPASRLRGNPWLTGFIALLAATGFAILASLSFHFHSATMRYQMDYAPILLLASVLGWTMFCQQFDRDSTTARVLQTGAVMAVVWSAAFSIAITMYPCAGTGSC